MRKDIKYILQLSLFLVLLFIQACTHSCDSQVTDTKTQFQSGADRVDDYLPYLKNRKVALVVNHSSLVGKEHLLDTLLALGVEVTAVLAPEHGFRGDADAGAAIKDEVDSKSGLPVVSLYGKKKKPSLEDLHGAEIIVFDIQDVGVRFYTYISTLHNVMQTAMEVDLPVLVLDRPNPNAHYVDGPILDPEFSSFVGMHPVPVVYGMTIGEYAQMINGEYWMGGAGKLRVIPMQNYSRYKKIPLNVKPSPNLPNLHSIALYPSLCFFEGTIMSVGRGTDFPFQVYGHPEYPTKSFYFEPVPKLGASSSPLYNGKKCYGVDLRGYKTEGMSQLNLHFLLDAYKNMKQGDAFFNSFFEKLAGTDELRKQIRSGMSEQDIRASWEYELEIFRSLRRQYLIYPE